MAKSKLQPVIKPSCRGLTYEIFSNFAVKWRKNCDDFLRARPDQPEYWINLGNQLPLRHDDFCQMIRVIPRIGRKLECNHVILAEEEKFDISTLCEVSRGVYACFRQLEQYASGNGRITSELMPPAPVESFKPRLLNGPESAIAHSRQTTGLDDCTWKSEGSPQPCPTPLRFAHRHRTDRRTDYSSPSANYACLWVAESGDKNW